MALAWLARGSGMSDARLRHFGHVFQACLPRVPVVCDAPFITWVACPSWVAPTRLPRCCHTAPTYSDGAGMWLTHGPAMFHVWLPCVSRVVQAANMCVSQVLQMWFKGVSHVVPAWLTHGSGVIQALLTQDSCGSHIVEDPFTSG